MKKVLTILIILSSTLLLSGCGADKYEGLTAEEWKGKYRDAVDLYYAENNKYKELRSCVENYDGLSIQQKSQYGGVFYYCK